MKSATIDAAKAETSINGEKASVNFFESEHYTRQWRAKCC